MKNIKKKTGWHVSTGWIGKAVATYFGLCNKALKSDMNTLSKLCHIAVPLFAFIFYSSGQGIIAYHSEYQNPLSEGWNWDFRSGFGSPQFAAITNDAGHNAWQISLASSGGAYSKTINSIPAKSWLLSANLKVLSHGADSIGSPFTISVTTGSVCYGLYFGANSNGDQVFFVMSGFYISPQVILNGGEKYNNFQLAYNYPANQATMSVNGVEQFAQIPGAALVRQPSLSWGGANQLQNAYQANWNLVSLQVIPEPSSALVVLLGGAVLASGLKCKAQRQNQHNSIVSRT